MDIFHHLRDYGAWIYLIIFVWTFCEGETCVIFAGVALSKGHLDPALVIGSAWSGAAAGDLAIFAVSRTYGKRLLVRFPRLVAPVDRAVRLLERYSTAFILSFRFIYGIRNGAGIAVGLSNISAARFAALNLIAAGLWAGAFTLLGYMAGAAHTAMADEIGSTLSMVALGLFVLVAAVIVVTHKIRVRRARARAAATVATILCAEIAAEVPPVQL